MKKEENFSTNLTKLYLMTMLSKKPSHGYELMEGLGKLTGKNPSAGQIYPLLNILVKKKYVTVKSESTGKRKRKVYKLTPTGKKFSSQLLSKFGELVDISIKMKVTKCAHCDCQIYKGGHRRKIKDKSLSFCCKNCANAYAK
jgi:DNA-binding PadR family transcriptional regulator